MKPRSTRAQGDGLPSHAMKSDNGRHPNNLSTVSAKNTACFPRPHAPEYKPTVDFTPRRFHHPR